MSDQRTTLDRQKVVELLKDSKRLTAWEVDFIGKMDQLSDALNYTDRQHDKIEQIWQKIFGE